MFVFSRHRTTSSSGFTLIEILVVITILAILILMALINGPRFITKANDATRKSDLQAYKIAFEHYYEDKGCYPSADELTSCSAPSDTLRPYLPKMLCDPQTRQPYTFDIQGCTSFKVFTTLYNGDDPDIAKVGCSVGCGIEGVNEGFNFGVSSTNTRVGDPNALGGSGDAPAPSSTPNPSSNPGGSSLGHSTYLPLNCVLQSNGSWDCNCTAGAACGLGCPGNTLCSSDGKYCTVDTLQCPVGPQ